MTEASCAPYFEDVLSLDGDGELRVYRCDWGWCVKRGDHAGRSRYLDEAFQLALGRRLDAPEVKAMIETLERELTASRDAEGRTASTTVRLPKAAVSAGHTSHRYP